MHKQKKKVMKMNDEYEETRKWWKTGKMMDMKIIIKKLLQLRNRWTWNQKHNNDENDEDKTIMTIITMMKWTWYK